LFCERSTACVEKPCFLEIATFGDLHAVNGDEEEFTDRANRTEFENK
jgi:hypothetical protein